MAGLAEGKFVNGLWIPDCYANSNAKIAEFSGDRIFSSPRRRARAFAKASFVAEELLLRAV